MTRYYSLTCYADTPEGKKKNIEGWHNSLRKALWCHAIKNPKRRSSGYVICAKDNRRSEAPRPLTPGDEGKEIARHNQLHRPWDLTPRGCQGRD